MTDGEIVGGLDEGVEAVDLLLTERAIGAAHSVEERFH
jgi:hypothetical protein